MNQKNKIKCKSSICYMTEKDISPPKKQSHARRTVVVRACSKHTSSCAQVTVYTHNSYTKYVPENIKIAVNNPVIKSLQSLRPYCGHMSLAHAFYTVINFGIYADSACMQIPVELDSIENLHYPLPSGPLVGVLILSAKIYIYCRN